MKHSLTKHLLLIVALAATLAGCHTEPKQPPRNSIYHWKSTFCPDSTELAILKEYDITRIYMKMFDVSVEQNHLSGIAEVVPIATTKFLSPIPNGVEIVPTAFITIEALRAMAGKEAEFAELIVERMLAMCSYNKCGPISELQLDCDWTSSTRYTYATLCEQAKGRLAEYGIELSITLRLHQLGETPPPADRAVLMLYNTGAIKDPSTENSILDIDNVRPYLKRNSNYPLPLSYAYPAFGWGVRFRGEEFVAITSENAEAAEGETIRFERPTIADIYDVKVLVEERLGKPQGGNIIYHLDTKQLDYYTPNEILLILAH